MRVSRRQVQRNVVPVVDLKVSRENVMGVKKYLYRITGGSAEVGGD